VLKEIRGKATETACFFQVEQPLAEGTVTSADELRSLIAQAKADGYAISAGEREDSASGLSARFSIQPETRWAR
jgi:DNA-binding IclR family transcriptional regulator